MRKAIPGYEGIYDADESGDIFSVYLNKPISKRDDQRGYLVSTLHKGGIKKHIKVHRLIAAAFIENKNNLEQINHIDGNKKNNRHENLEWCSALQNLRHARNSGLIKNRSFDGYVGKNIKTGEIIKFEKQNEAELKGFDSSTISKCCKGTRNKHKGFTWSYDSCRRTV